MAKVKDNDSAEPANSFRFSLTGLIVLVLCVMATTAAIPRLLSHAKPKAVSFPGNDIPDPDDLDKDLSIRKGPWGELLTQNIMLELPTEYISQEVSNPEPETWNFANMGVAQIRAVLAGHGLTLGQVEAQVTPDRVSVHGTNTVFTPDENFLLSLNPTTRATLYTSLNGLGVGIYVDFPYVFPNGTTARIYADPRLNPQDVAVLKQLVYPTEDSERLTDYNLLLRKIPTAERRVTMSKVISMQPAVLVRLCVRPDSDIDKIAAYWGNMENVRFTDLRPMLEALKSLPRGGTVSLMYFFPPFARARLYTYPLPPKPGDPRMDCHWSTFNFSNVELNNDVNNPQYLMEHIRKDFYKIDSPSLYGDILLYLDNRNAIKHSAVFLADDLAFTKYGSGYRQPWMIVRMADMQAMYPAFRLVCFRRSTK